MDVNVGVALPTNTFLAFGGGKIIHFHSAALHLKSLPDTALKSCEELVAQASRLCGISGGRDARPTGLLIIYGWAKGP